MIGSLPPPSISTRTDTGGAHAATIALSTGNRKRRDGSWLRHHLHSDSQRVFPLTDRMLKANHTYARTTSLVSHSR